MAKKQKSCKQRFPEVIWAKWSDDSWDGKPVLLAEEEIKEIAEKDERIVVGCYKFEGTAIVANQTELELDQKRN